jgi:CYTH domain-containing protein
MSDAIEIERKFLVTAAPDLSGATPAKIRQGYLTSPEDSVEIRLRDKDGSCVMTFKSGEGVVRVERELPVTEDQFNTLWPETDGRRVEKTRWTGSLPGGLVFEYDDFEGALEPLKMVEVEFTSEEAANAFVPPDWFGADVTSDKRFKNKTMALKGLPDGI